MNEMQLQNQVIELGKRLDEMNNQLVKVKGDAFDLVNAAETKRKQNEESFITFAKTIAGELSIKPSVSGINLDEIIDAVRKLL